MIDIREFQSGQLFGLKIHDGSIRSHYRRVVASQYNEQHHGFEARTISSEGVARFYQTLNFESPEQAMEWANTPLAQQLTGYTADAFEIVRAGYGNYQRIPVAGVQFDGWVKPLKFEVPISLSQSKMDRLIELAPEYFDPETERVETNNQPATNNRRGFFR